MSCLSGLCSHGKFAIRTEFWGNVFFLLYFDSRTSEIRVPELDVKIWEPMYRTNWIPAWCSGNNLIGDLFSHPEKIRWSTSLSNRRLNLYEKVWYFPKHRTTTGKTLTFYYIRHRKPISGNLPILEATITIMLHADHVTKFVVVCFVPFHKNLLELTECKFVSWILTFKAAL